METAQLLQTQHPFETGTAQASNTGLWLLLLFALLFFVALIVGIVLYLKQQQTENIPNI